MLISSIFELGFSPRGMIIIIHARMQKIVGNIDVTYLQLKFMLKITLCMLNQFL
jgi:hypothetical protein